MDTSARTHRWQHGNEELTAVRVRPSIGHTDRVRPVVFERRHELVLEVATPDRLAAGSGAGRIARLHHEALDDPMEYVPVVVAILAVHAKVLHRFRALGGEQFDVHIALGRVQRRRIVDALHTWTIDGGGGQKSYSY